MKRQARTWTIFAIASLLVLAALSQVSRVLIDAAFEKRWADEARRHQDKERVALWQLDFAISPLIAYETGRAIALESGARPEDFMAIQDDFVAARFRREEGALRADFGEADLAVLDLPVRPETFLSENPEVFAANEAWLTNGAAIPGGLNSAQNDLPGRQLQQNRSNALNPMSNFAQNIRPMPASLEPFKPIWVDRRDDQDPELLLFRRGLSEQFVLLNREKLESWLKEEVHEVLPDLRLVPQREKARAGQSVLAALPYRLLSAPEKGRGQLDSSFMTTLGIAWGAVLLSLLATAFVLRATTTLSERRARFVSTVTHELRTPLTTFRMYAQMLAKGMVSTEEKRAAYLATLESESARLARVVESVMLYARLEEGRAEARREEISLADLADRLMSALGPAAQAGDMELDIDIEGDAEQLLKVDAQSIEQILVNLADNAQKYGRGFESRMRVLLHCEARSLIIDFNDYGPGVPEGESRAIFKAFHRAQAHAADANSGIGLGLSLARGLARAQSGDLVLHSDKHPGAHFQLRLPLH